jgi:DNA modification methylase
MQALNHIYCGNVLDTIKEIPNDMVHCVVTSPPYFGLRDYGVDGQIGAEQTPEEFVEKMVQVFREVRRVLRPDGVCWLNLGDSYYNYRPGKGQALQKQSCAKTNQDLPQDCPRRGNKLDGLKEKDLIGIPWMTALALRKDGWYLRQDVIWAKNNPMPESVKDRCTKNHEYIFMLTKSAKYFFNNEAIKEPAKDWGSRNRDNGKYHNEGTGLSPHSGLKDCDFSKRGKNKRSVWHINNRPYKGAHFATFPPELPETCIKASCPDGGIVFDPFIGSGTTAMVAHQLGRQWIGCELNPKYVEMAYERIYNTKKTNEKTKNIVV